MDKGLDRRLKKWFNDWKSELSKYKLLILISIILLILANVFNVITSTYVDSINTIVVHDIILDHLPSLNLEFIFVYGLLAVFFVIALYIIIFRVKLFHIAVFDFSLLIFARSCFMVLTHLGQPANAVVMDNVPAIFNFLTVRNDLFFSGHTAVPFMAFLLFRKEKIGLFFLAMTIILAATVLIMHVHYSIDVFSAFFITYGVYMLGNFGCDKVCYRFVR